MAIVQPTAVAVPRKPKKLYQQLYVQVLFAITVGILLGHFYPSFAQEMKPLGDAFIKLVKMIIAPVIFLTVVTGIAGMRDMGKVGRVAGKAMLYFITFSTMALIIGMIVANVIRPGAGLNIDPASLDPKAVAGYAAKAHETSITGFLMNIIPNTPVSAFESGDILQVLFFSVLLGIALSLVGEKADPLMNVLNSLSAGIFKLVAILMKAAPIGAFGAMAFTIGRYGIGSIANLALLIATFYITSLLFVLVVLGAVARYNGFSILALIRYIKEELLLVLGTSSSEAALPALMEKMEKAGCAKSVVGLVVPTGYSFNLDGTCLYLATAAVFLAQATNTPLPLGDQLALLAVLLVLGTSSSEAALPTLMEKLERAGCRKSVVGLVVPTGYSFNLDGTNIYMTMAALCIAHAVGIDLSIWDQIRLLLVAMLSSKGAAGITGAGFITLAATLSVVPSVPVAGMALILGIDRFMSECRALTNFVGNAVATVVVARWEGELDRAKLNAALSGQAEEKVVLAAPVPAAE